MTPSRNGGPAGPSGLAFGVPPSLSETRRSLLDALSVYLSTRLGISVAVHRALSYADLTNRMATGTLHAAWLPPAVYVELEREMSLRILVAAERGAGVGYFAAFFTLIDSDVVTIDDTVGHSVAWVDASSAAGYVYPRLQLAAHGIDPTTAFQEELFFRSHEAVVRAVVDHAVDLGATYVHLDPKQSRKVVRAGWRPPPTGVDPASIKWLEPFGPLPPDVIATSTTISPAIATRMRKAFMEIHEVEEVRLAAQEQFGTGRFVAAEPKAYDILRKALDAAEGKGVEALSSLRPSHRV